MALVPRRNVAVVMCLRLAGFVSFAELAQKLVPRQRRRSAARVAAVARARLAAVRLGMALVCRAVRSLLPQEARLPRGTLIPPRWVALRPPTAELLK